MGGTCRGLTGVGRRGVEAVGDRDRAIERKGEGRSTPLKIEPPGLSFRLGVAGIGQGGPKGEGNK
jgi:hypothetical protein